jgi:hypothetical protein
MFGKYRVRDVNMARDCIVYKVGSRRSLDEERATTESWNRCTSASLSYVFSSLHKLNLAFHAPLPYNSSFWLYHRIGSVDALPIMD